MGIALAIPKEFPDVFLNFVNTTFREKEASTPKHMIWEENGLYQFNSAA